MPSDTEFPPGSSEFRFKAKVDWDNDGNGRPGGCCNVGGTNSEFSTVGELTMPPSSSSASEMPLRNGSSISSGPLYICKLFQSTLIHLQGHKGTVPENNELMVSRLLHIDR